MNKVSRSDIVTTGLAIFSMLFGAGNLMYPIVVGLKSGASTPSGMAGFLITAVCLPIAGLVGMILFNGDYFAYFNRLGKIPGAFLVSASVIIIGPLIALPRIVTLSHTMIAPFIPITFLQNSNDLFASFVFSLIFLGVTFLATFRENKIVQILGRVISPILLFSLLIIIIKGMWSCQHATTAFSNSQLDLFKMGFMTGYETLDLLGALFFASIVLNILKNTMGDIAQNSTKKLALVSTQAGVIGVTLLGLVYIGMSILGMFHGHGLETATAGELFRELSFKILGNHGALLISTAVLMACLSTSIALSAVVAEYFEQVIFRRKISFVSALIAVLVATIPLSTFGLGYVLKLTGGPITYVGYPIIITLTLCNIAYKLFDFKPVKIPVLATFIVALVSYIW